jgi:hypothetical protein
MPSLIPHTIEDASLVYSDSNLLNPNNVVSQMGKFFVMAQWHSPTYNDACGWIVYDCYILAWAREGNLKDGEIYATLYYDSIEPKGVVDLWSVSPLLKKSLSGFNLDEFIERIRNHRLTKV